MPKKADRIKLTPEKLDALKTTKSREFVYDAKSPLVVKVTNKGGKSFMVRQRIPKGQLVEMVLTTLPATGENLHLARQEAQRLAQIIESGRDPREPAEPSGHRATVAEAIRETIAEKQRGGFSAATIDQYESALRAVEDATTIADRPLEDLSLRDLSAALDSIWRYFEKRQRARGRSDNGVYERHRVGRALRHVFKQARQNGHISYEKFHELRDFRQPRLPKREGNPLDPDDVGKLWAAVGQPANAVDGLIAFVLATGCRPGEARKLTWGRIRWAGERPEVHLPAETVKTRTARTIPLTARLYRLLEAMPKGGEDAPVFSDGGDKPLNPYLNYSRKLRAQRAGLSREFDFTALRSTVKNQLLGELDQPEFAVNLLLGHNLDGVDAHYVNSGQSYRKKLAALEAWHSRLDELAASVQRDAAA